MDQLLSGTSGVWLWVLANGMNVLMAVATLLAGFWLSGAASRMVRRLAEKNARLDKTLFSFIASLARYAILAFTGIAVLERFGVQTTSLVALIGAAGLAIGLALQGTLSNLAAGVMLLLFRPFKVGDGVQIGGLTGVVREMTLFTVELVTPDNTQIMVPNSQVWGSPITNFTFHPIRRVDLVFGVAYNTDLRAAEAAVREVLAADPRVLSEPAATIQVVGLGDFAINLGVNLWVKTPDYAVVKSHMLRAVKEAFDAKGIEIPFPTSVQIELPAK